MAQKPRDFSEIKASAETAYRKVGEVHCPYLGCVVHFDAKGLEHIKFKARGRARSKSDQEIRLKLLHLAPEIVKLSRTLQGIQERQQFESVKKNKRRERILKRVTYYEFIAVLKGIRIRVIVKQVAGGAPHFWSIIPYWKQDKNTGKRKLHTGNPDED